MSFWTTAGNYIDYYTRLRGITVDDMGVGEVCVVSWAPGPVKRMAEQVGAHPSPHWPLQARYPMFTGTINGTRVSLAHVTMGAPLTVAQIEQMIACGAKMILGLGWAGSLNPVAPVTSLLVPTTCIREEGTSYHYLGDDAVVQSNTQLASILVEASQAAGITVNRGPHWTTDAIYREGKEKIKAYREFGVLGVDMETSAMFALGQVFDVAVANLLVVSDTLWEGWEPAFSTETMREATIRAEQVMVSALHKAVALYQAREGQHSS